MQQLGAYPFPHSAQKHCTGWSRLLLYLQNVVIKQQKTNINKFPSDNVVDVKPKSHYVLLVIKVLICDCVTKDIVEDLVEWNNLDVK